MHKGQPFAQVPKHRPIDIGEEGREREGHPHVRASALALRIGSRSSLRDNQAMRDN